MVKAKPAGGFNVGRFVIILLIVVLIFLFTAGVVSITGLWNTILLEPMLNFLVLMSKYFLGSFGIAVILLTIVVRLLTLPLIMRQLQSSKATQALRPKTTALQKKYAKDSRRLAAEMSRLYKEAGVNPLGCAFPMLLQFPIWIALYQSVMQALAFTPENLLGLSRQLYYPWVIRSALPLNHNFLLLNLGSGNIFMAVLTAASFWVLQKMSSTPGADSQQQNMNRVMLWLIPLLFGFVALTFPSALALFWVVSNIIQIVIQYRMAGWGTLKMPSPALLKRGTSQPAGNPAAKTEVTIGTVKKAEKVVPSQQGTARTGSASSKKKETARGDITSEGNKDDHDKAGGERKV
jgi:YidC/Oxa1 family membrane protein insertase